MGARSAKTLWSQPLILAALGATFLFFTGATGCPTIPPAQPNPYNYNNTTDPTNGGATTVGKAACASCHPDYAERVEQHAHNAFDCEECHGPGSNHLPNPFARMLYVDLTGAQTCGKCHGKPPDADAGEIRARDDFVDQNQQWVELRASGGHSSFNCGYCHDPHYSTVNDRPNGLRNECVACHDDQNMALHKGVTFTGVDYVETLTCESCHLPNAVLKDMVMPPEVVGPYAHVADRQSHIFRLSGEQVDFNAFLSDDKMTVRLDSEGRAAITADMVCLRCHNSVSLPTLAFTPERAAEIAAKVHLDTVLNQRQIRELLNRPQ